MTLRARANGGIGKITAAGCMLLVVFVAGASFGLLPMMLFGLIGTLGFTETWQAWVGLIGGFALTALLATGLWLLMRLGVRRMFERHYSRTWQELHRTSFMSLVAMEDYTNIVAQRINDAWSLRWVSPPPPKNLEQQLEYAASYQLALRRMIRGVGRLDNGPLWQGSFGWYVGRYGFCCCCLLWWLPYIGALGAPLLIVCGIYYTQGCAALAAYCDFLLYDDRSRSENQASPPA